MTTFKAGDRIRLVQQISSRQVGTTGTVVKERGPGSVYQYVVDLDTDGESDKNLPVRDYEIEAAETANEPYDQAKEFAFPEPPPIVLRAPSQSENFAGPRAFMYEAEVDVLGWKFRANAEDGSLDIETPILPNAVGFMRLGPKHQALIAALLDLAAGGQTDPLSFPFDPENIGMVG